jgi:hypothetical protein
MARPLRLLISALLAAAAASASAQAPQPAESAPAKPERQGRGGGPGGPMSPELRNVGKALESLSPEQLKHFQENFLRWSNLSPEEKKALRDRDDLRRKRMVEDVDAAIREAGLELDKDRREIFVKRYAEERRKLEEELRKEMEEKRQPLLKALRERLKVEFSTPASTATVTPAQ